MLFGVEWLQLPFPTPNVEWACVLWLSERALCVHVIVYVSVTHCYGNHIYNCCVSKIVSITVILRMKREGAKSSKAMEYDLDSSSIWIVGKSNRTKQKNITYEISILFHRLLLRRKEKYISILLLYKLALTSIQGLNDISSIQQSPSSNGKVTHVSWNG